MAGVSWAERQRRIKARAATAERESLRAGFLKELQSGLSPSAAARSVGKDPRFFKTWRIEDRTFAEDWDASVEEGVDFIMDSALKEALVGQQVPIMHGGKTVAYKTVKDTVLLIAIMNARRGLAPGNAGTRRGTFPVAPPSTTDAASRLLEKARAMADGDKPATRGRLGKLST